MNLPLDKTDQPEEIVFNLKIYATPFIAIHFNEIDIKDKSLFDLDVLGFSGYPCEVRHDDFLKRVLIVRIHETQLQDWDSIESNIGHVKELLGNAKIAKVELVSGRFKALPQ